MQAPGRRRSTHVAVFALLMALSPPALTASGTALIYDAFLSGAPVGTARLTFNRSESGYRIEGTASADGVAHLFSSWQTHFQAVGGFREGRPQLQRYAYDERERRKRRVLSLAEGMVHQVKDGQVRSSFPVLSGTDVLTAFFVEPGCWPDRLLHTGRYNYRIQGRPAKQPDSCDFVISDDEGSQTRIHVRFGMHERFRVPVLVRTRGLLRASVRLRESPSAIQLARKREL